MKVFIAVDSSEIAEKACKCWFNICKFNRNYFKLKNILYNHNFFLHNTKS